MRQRDKNPKRAAEKWILVFRSKYATTRKLEQPLNIPRRVQPDHFGRWHTR